MPSFQKLIVITGQTATGKTALALTYAHQNKGELVNADSRQVYKGLDIISGKDLKEIQKSSIPIHLIDLVSPDLSFSSFDYISSARKIIDDLWKRGRTPIIVGGTYLYIKQLVYGQTVTVPPNPQLRSELEKFSVKQLQDKLLSIDKSILVSMNSSDQKNPRRLIRRIEILSSPKRVMDKENIPLTADLKIIGLKHKDTTAARSQITKRVNKRVRDGAVEEVKRLLSTGYTKSDPGLQTIGYQQLIEYIEGTKTLDKAIEEWITAEVQYAKRQLTFMKTNPKIKWLIV